MIAPLLLWNASTTSHLELDQMPVADLFTQLCCRPSNEMFELVRNRRFYFARVAQKPDHSNAETLAQNIIRRGAESIQVLLTESASKKHVDLVLGPGEFNLVKDHGFLDPKKRPKGFRGEPIIDQLIDLPSLESYGVTRGDIAAFLLGIVTNRLYFRPEVYPGMTFFATPGSAPVSLNKVKREWTGTSKIDLEKSLEYDLYHPDSAARQIEAFAALRFYYPGKEVDRAVKSLRSSFLECAGDGPSVKTSLIYEFQQIACDRIDNAVIQVLKRLEVSASLRKRSPFAFLHSLMYLSKRSKYRMLVAELSKLGERWQPEYATYYDDLRQGKPDESVL